MDRVSFVAKLDDAVQFGLDWLYTNGAWFFDAIDDGLGEVYSGIEWMLLSPPYWVMVVLFGLLGWKTVGVTFALLAGAGLLGCAVMGLWDETMSTLALVLSSVVIALIIAIPIGIVAGLKAGVNRYVQVAVDVIQTIPPYIYLLPGVALIGYGPATAMTATIVVAISPALRLTALGIQLTPLELVELGRANGASSMQMLFKIRLPLARPSIMTGINQSLMVSVGMVVIAGIVGAEGLGFVIYEAIRTLDIGKAIDGGISIVIVTMVLDRISQGLGAEGAMAAQ
jgi:glycine betaine/proline transport system permease protein